MGDLILTENITLDGVVDLRAGWFWPPSDPEDEPDLLAANRRFQRAAGAVLLGRQTFEDFRSYWPTLTHDRTGITEYLNQVPKFVVSRTLTEPGWANTTVLRGSLREEVEALKAGTDTDIVCTGSIHLAHGLIEAGLVEEYRLFVYPVVIGAGARLFEGAALPRLELVESQAFASGVVLLRHRVL